MNSTGVLKIVCCGGSIGREERKKFKDVRAKIFQLIAECF